MTRRVFGLIFTVKVAEPVVPPGVVKVTLLAPTVALELITKLAVTVVSVAETPVTVMPEMLFTEAPVKYVPAKDTGTVAPCFPDPGLMPVSVGALVVTVKVTEPLEPPGPVTDTLRAPTAAMASIMKLAVTVVDVEPGDEKVIPERALTVA